MVCSGKVQALKLPPSLRYRDNGVDEGQMRLFAGRALNLGEGSLVETE
jgi:hypothetical protein